MLLYGGKKRNTKKIIWITAGVVALLAATVGIVLLTTDIDLERFTRAWDRLIHWITGLNPVAVIPLMAVLPIAGFPIAVVYLVAGARFGPLVGGLIVAGVTVVHMVGTYYVGRSFLRGPLERFIARRHKHLPQVPEDEQAAVALLAALVPGLPYFVRNYILVLAGVRLKVMLYVCVPVYVARSYVTILLGNLGSDPSKLGLIILLTVDVLKFGICAIVIWRLRVHHRKYHGHEEHGHDHLPGHEHGSAAPVPPTGATK
ncbi:MAG: VTT domain-containing protein [Verrucomicrobiota bacterium]